MSAHVLWNLLNELGKKDKMRGLPSILSLFRNEFNKFNYTRARMLDSIYHMTLSHFCRKNVIILSLCTQRCYVPLIYKPQVVYRFYCMALLHSQTRHHNDKVSYPLLTLHADSNTMSSMCTLNILYTGSP